MLVVYGDGILSLFGVKRKNRSYLDIIHNSAGLFNQNDVDLTCNIKIDSDVKKPVSLESDRYYDTDDLSSIDPSLFNKKDLLKVMTLEAFDRIKFKFDPAWVKDKKHDLTEWYDTKTNKVIDLDELENTNITSAYSNLALTNIASTLQYIKNYIVDIKINNSGNVDITKIKIEFKGLTR